jgi:membrane dipeptidase
MIPIFDGHNDVLLRLWLKKSKTPARDFIAGDNLGHIDLPRLKAGGMVGGLYAIFPPPVQEVAKDDFSLNQPLDQAVPREAAHKSTYAMLDILDDIVAQGNALTKFCLTAKDIRGAIANKQHAMVFHIEGAEAISADLDGLDALYSRGLRSLGPVWSRPNCFGDGVPFRFPSSADTGGGLTASGKALVKACNQKRIVVDCSHMTEAAFWDTARTSDAPLVASHSNAHAIASSSRNLNDRQLAAIAERKGLVGLNFATGFLRSDGHWDVNTGLDVMLRHIDHMLTLLSEDGVALGSDFDGARIPAAIGSAAGLQNLVNAMLAHGYGEALVKKIAGENWINLLERIWGE